MSGAHPLVVLIALILEGAKVVLQLLGITLIDRLNPRLNPTLLSSGVLQLDWEWSKAAVTYTFERVKRCIHTNDTDDVQM